MPSSPLLDRAGELAALRDAWERARSGEPQLALAYGRRRVGKTFLLLHFASGKRHVFHSATRQSEGVELERLVDSVGQGLGQDVVDRTAGRFGSWEAALRFLATEARDEPLLVVLDEIPYLAESTSGFGSIVQAFWDRLGAAGHNKLMLVLTGSAIGVVEKLLDGRGPLYGRPTLRLQVEPVALQSASLFLPRLDPEQLIEAYAACGGYPLHLKTWDAAASTEQNLLALAGRPGGLLLDDAMQMLAEEFHEAPGFERVLTAIGRGRTRYGEIATDAGQRIERPIRLLEHVGLIRRETPVGAPARARPLYRIVDPYLAFWFSMLHANLGLISAGQGRVVLRRVWPRWGTHLGAVFEELCRAHASRLVEAGVFDEDLLIGRWWASSGEPCEIDIVGLKGNMAALIGEARWQGAPLRARDVAALREKAARAPGAPAAPVLALWGRDGLDAGLAGSGVLGFDAGDVVTAGLGSRGRRRRH